MNIFNNNYILNNTYDSIKSSRLQSTYKQLENINKKSIFNTTISSDFSNYITPIDSTSQINNTNKFITINEGVSLNNSTINNSNLSSNLDLQLLSINNQALNSSLLSNNSLINNYIDSIYSEINNLNTVIGSVSNNNSNSANIDNIEKWVNEACEKYNIDSDLVMAIIKAESTFNSNAISNSGAVGLMQLMPTTAKEMGLIVNNNVDERFNPQKNIEAGVKYLAKYHNVISNKLGKEDWSLTIAGYNCGPNRVIKDGKIPNITETQNYVKKVQKYWNEYKSI